MKHESAVLVLATAGVIFATGVQNAGAVEQVDPSNKQLVSYGKGGSNKRPKLYDYYYSRNNSPTLSPFIVTPPVNGTPVILGPVRPYSENEYGRLVISSLSANRVQPAGAKISTKSVIEEEILDDGTKNYKLAEVRISDVLDRGTVMVETGEVVKLRGVRVPTERDPDERIRYHAREAMRSIRNAAGDQTVFLVFQEPIRSGDGNILAEIYLPDGTSINRLLINEGLGKVDEGDYYPHEDLTPLKDAETVARKAKRGLWGK
ncbi:MAG: thermonuclease family protein [Candidatus Sumerlaeaceae bacterium]|nr:thermonuclease family protein [Candidatus Sumerlaeaceae bacterium]